MTEFTELYKKLSNSELLKIISESEKYNPVAIETAKLEIESRKLSVDDLNKAESYIEAKKEKKKTEVEQRKLHQEKLKKKAFSFFETISPIQNGIQTPERIIRLITIIFGSISIYKIYENFYFFRYVLIDGIDKWDFSTFLYLVELLLLPATVILFWKRKRIGWVLLALLITSSLVSAIALFFSSFNRQPSGIIGLDKLFPVISPMTYFIAFIFNSAVLWLICKKSVNSIFKVSEQTVFLSISLTIIVQLLLILLVF